MFEAVVLILPHYCEVFFFLVFKAAKVQHAVKYYPMQLVLIGGLEFCSIILYPLHAYVYFALHRLFTFAHVEGNDIGKGIVIEIALIDIEQEVIVAKDIAEVSYLYFGAVFTYLAVYKCRQFSFIL